MLITITQAAQIAGVSESYLRRLCRQGKIPARKYGWVWLIEEQDLEGVSK